MSKLVNLIAASLAGTACVAAAAPPSAPAPNTASALIAHAPLGGSSVTMAAPTSMPATSAAESGAQSTLEQMAQFARQAQEAAALVKPAGAASAAAGTYRGDPGLPPAPYAGGGNASPGIAPGPRLVEIMGSPGREMARVALDGYIYTVSPQSPGIGTSHWSLVKIDVPARAVELRDGTGRKGHVVELGFAERDPDAQSSSRGAMPGAFVPPAPYAGAR